MKVANWREASAPGRGVTASDRTPREGLPRPEAGAATDLRNNDGVTPLEAVSGPWSEELRGLYEFFDGIFQMQLDIDRIREVRPEVHAILQAAG